MTRRDYVALARAIKAAKPRQRDALTPDQAAAATGALQTVGARLALHCAANDPAFCSATFYRNAGLEGPFALPESIK